MANVSLWLGGILVVSLILLGVLQSATLPRSTLAGAATTSQSQEQINTCMKDCMWDCVKKEGDERPCLAQCDVQCGVKNPE